MQLISWNIRFAPEYLVPLAVDEKFPWKLRSKGIASFVEQQDVQVFATQEGNFEQLRDLDSKLKKLKLYSDSEPVIH